MASMRDMRATGATARQVDHWTRGGRLRSDSPESLGAGNRRSWPDEEVAVCRLLVRLTAAGLAIDRAELVARGEYEIGPGILVFINGDGLQHGVEGGEGDGEDPAQEADGDPAEGVAPRRSRERAPRGRAERTGREEKQKQHNDVHSL